MKRISFAAISISILFLGCGDNEPLPSHFWPLAEGNQWVTSESYSWQIVGGTSGSSTSKTTYTVEPFVKSTKGKLLWPVAVSTDTSGSGTGLTLSRTYYYTTEDSVYLYADTLESEPKAVEPNDLAVGMEWDGNLALPIQIPSIPSFSTTFPAHFEVVDDTDITVPAGTFNSLVIRIDLDNSGTIIDSAATQWRARDVGIVKMTTDFTTTYVIVQVKINGSSELESMNF